MEGVFNIPGEVHKGDVDRTLKELDNAIKEIDEALEQVRVYHSYPPDGLSY